MTSLLDSTVTTLAGDDTTLGALTAGRGALLVNVASKCGLTPQYAKLEAMQRDLADQNFTVIGFPCNQFMAQEPGTAGEIEQFCSSTYGVTFPMSDKIEVNGEDRDPIYAALADHPDSEGYAGDIRWNFEKFVLDPQGRVVARFGPQVEPDDEAVQAAVTRVVSG